MAYGNINADVLQSSTAGTAPVFKDGSGVETGQLCRAWVNFNGVTMVTVNAQYNVSSITRNAAGDYTLNFSSSLTDANYSVAGCTTGATAGTNVVMIKAASGASAPTVKSATQVEIITGSGGIGDSANVSIAIFR